MSEAPVRYGEHAPAPSGDCEGCGKPVNKPMADHCHEHGWVRGRVCARCNRLLSYVDARIRPRVTEELLVTLMAIRDRCPDCKPLAIADLAFSGHPKSQEHSEEEKAARARVQRMASRRNYRLFKRRAHECPTCSCGAYLLVPMPGTHRRRGIFVQTLAEAEEFLLSDDIRAWLGRHPRLGGHREVSTGGSAG